jgi:hypothetical protein
VLLTSTDERNAFFTMNVNLNSISNAAKPSAIYNDRGQIGSAYNVFNDEIASSYFAYLRQANRSFNDTELKGILNYTNLGGANKKAFIRNNPPVNADNVFKAVIDDTGTVYLVNTQNTRESFELSSTRNNLKRASIPTAKARQLLGQDQPATGQVAAQVGGVARRGRPAGQPNAPQPAAQPVAAGNVNVGEIMQAAGITNGFLDLPRSVRNRINVNNATSVPAANNRGASRRLNILGGAGRITSVLEIGPSTIYFIRLNNGGTVASVVVQPGNSHYLITAQSAYQLESPSQLLQALQQRNLAEIHQYLVNEYMERNPEHLNEFKELLRKHINEKKNASE